MNFKKLKVLGGTLLLSTTIGTTLNSNLVLAKTESTSNKEIVVMYNGEKMEFDTEPIIKDGSTLVPFRAIFENMGTMVYYDPTEKTILGITETGNMVKHQVGTNSAFLNHQEIKFTSSSEVINDRTLIPIRMVSELLEADVNWTNKTRTVTIEKEEVDSNPKIDELRLGLLENNSNPNDFERYIQYSNKHPEKSISEVIYEVSLDLDKELVLVKSIPHNPYLEGSHYDVRDEDKEPAINYDTDKLALIDKFNILPDKGKGYDERPRFNNSLIWATQGDKMATNYTYLKEEVIQPLKEMVDAATNDGIFLSYDQFDITCLASSLDVDFRNWVSHGNSQYVFDRCPRYICNRLRTGYALLFNDGYITGILHYMYNEGYEEIKNIDFENADLIPIEKEMLQYIINYEQQKFNGNADETKAQFDAYQKLFWENIENIKNRSFLLNILNNNFSGSETLVHALKRDYDAQQWLKENAYKYGFVQEMPAGKKEITKYEEVDSAYHYVGKEVAQVMRDENLCFKEYYAKYLPQSNYQIDKDSTKTKVLKK